MSKRLTDTDKWKKNSFSKLPLKMKLVWIYLCDNCDHAGIWEANFGLMSFQIGETITLEEIEKHFGDKITWINSDKIFLQGFIDFQYGKLNDQNRVHKSVLDKLQILRNATNSFSNISTASIAFDEKEEAPCKPLVSPLQGCKDKDKEKDKEKVLVKEQCILNSTVLLEEEISEKKTRSKKPRPVQAENPIIPEFEVYDENFHHAVKLMTEEEQRRIIHDYNIEDVFNEICGFSCWDGREGKNINLTIRKWLRKKGIFPKRENDKLMLSLENRFQEK